MTQLQEAAYAAQWAAGLPASPLAVVLLTRENGRISHHRCATYLWAIQETEWFEAAFRAHCDPVAVVGGPGRSHADAALHRVKIGTNDRSDVAKCELACLHELAHIVTSDHGPGEELREPAEGAASSKGHHHAWRANFVFLVRMTVGRSAATRLRGEFNAWGLPTVR